MKIKQIDAKTLDDFLANYKHDSFSQTSDFANRRKVDGWNPEFLGFYKNEELVGAVQLTSYKIFLNKKRYESIYGPLLPYDNLEETKECLILLKDYLIDNNATECTMNPNVKVAAHHPEFEELINKEQLIDAFKEAGWEYLENSDKDESTLRWFFVKDIEQFDTYKDLMDSYEPETKRLISNAKSFPLKVVELDVDNLDRAVNIFTETAERREFDTRDLKYHKTLFTHMNKKHEAKYLVVELDVKGYLDVLNNEANDIKADIEKDIDNTSKRAKNRVNQNKDQLKARENRINQLSKINQEVVDICSGVFIGANDTMTYLFGGSKEDYMRYYGTYFLQDFTIKYAYDNNYKKYDFYGTRCKLCGFPEEEGIFQFKQGFGGRLYENVGYFTFKPTNITNSVYEFLRNIKNK